MTHHLAFHHPTKCFCQVPEKELSYWATKRYKDNHTTMELLTQTNDPRQREVIGIVALLDVDEKSMLNLMGNVDKPEHHIIHCRENVRNLVGQSTG